MRLQLSETGMRTIFNSDIMDNNNDNSKTTAEELELNKQQQAVDKSPGEERGKGEKVTLEDLRGKKVDAFPSTEDDKPTK